MAFPSAVGRSICMRLAQQILQQFLMAAVGQRVVGHLRKEIFSAMRKLPWLFLTRAAMGI